MIYLKQILFRKTPQKSECNKSEDGQKLYLSDEQAKQLISQMKYNCLENLIFYNDQDNDLSQNRMQQQLEIDSDKVKLTNDGIIKLFKPKYYDVEDSFVDESSLSYNEEEDENALYQQIYEQMRVDMEEEMDNELFHHREKDYENMNAVNFQAISKNNLQNEEDDDDEWVDDDEYYEQQD